MTILITGFDAFAGIELNSSQMVVDALAKLELDGVVTAVLPTAYHRAESRIHDLIRRHRPDRVLMLGLARQARAIRLERAAQNLDDCAEADNEGDVRQRQKIVEAADLTHLSTLPLTRMAEIARELGNEVEFSRDAGGFVCNHVFFTTAQLIASELPDSRCGFVHLPALDAGSDELKRMVELIQAWLENGIE